MNTQQPPRQGPSPLVSIFSLLLVALLAFLLGVVFTNQVRSEQQWHEIRAEMQASMAELEDSLAALRAEVGNEMKEFAQDTEQAIDEASDEYE